MRHRRRLPLIVLWWIAGLLLVLSLGGQIAVVLLQSSQRDIYGMLGDSASSRQVLSNIFNVAPLILPHAVRAGVMAVVALLFLHAVRWQRAQVTTPTKPPERAR